MEFKIITDSAANLPEKMIDQYDLSVLSLSFFVEGKECFSYIEGEIQDLSRFYTMMREKQEIKTSLVNLEYAEKECKKILSLGQDVLYIGFSSGLSGSYQAVSLALESLKEDFPERKIFYVDSLSAALGQGLLVKYAVDLREEGKTLEEVYQWVLDNRLKLVHWFTVEDLFFLKRGGRVSAATAVLGTALSIKPVMHVDNQGHLVVMEKARGRKKSLDALVRHMEETAINPSEQVVYISHGDCQEDAEYVAQRVKERLQVKEVMIRVLDPVIGAHSGPGTVALFFMGNKR